MASRIVELFGYAPSDPSVAALQAREKCHCPFIDATCLKTLSDGIVSGVCTLQPMTTGPVICCPHRLYADNYKVLSDVAQLAFKQKNMALLPGNIARSESVPPGVEKVAVFGKGWGKELRLPNRGDTGSFFVDFVLARISALGKLEEFVAVEVQSIDTTGNYRDERQAYMQGALHDKNSTAGFNWENVNKRILPQLIYKGHVLRRERLCKNGLFFICPSPVYHKIRRRLGGNLYEYPMQPGALSILWYDLGLTTSQGKHRALLQAGALTTTVDQIVTAFSAPSDLPKENVYEEAIRTELGDAV